MLQGLWCKPHSFLISRLFISQIIIPGKSHNFLVLLSFYIFLWVEFLLFYSFIRAFHYGWGFGIRWDMGEQNPFHCSKQLHLLSAGSIFINLDHFYSLFSIILYTSFLIICKYFFTKDRVLYFCTYYFVLFCVLIRFLTFCFWNLTKLLMSLDGNVFMKLWQITNFHFT